MSKFNFSIFKTRKAKYGSLATVITAVTIILVIAINILAGVFSDKFKSSFDLTKNKAFNITQDSIDYIGKLSTDVEIIVLNQEDNFISNGEYFVQANEVIKQYSKHSNKIKVNYIDITKNPTFSTQYPNDELQTNSIIVKSSNRHKVLAASDLFDIEYSYYNSIPVSSKAEQTMTSAIMYVSTEKQTKISVIKGFDENPIDSFVELLKMNNYDVIEQAILTENINPESVAVIIPAPTRDYDDDAIKKVTEFLNNGGKYGKNLFYIASAQQGKTPKLDAFLKDWGVKVGEGTVFETSASKLLSTNNPFFAINEYVDQDFAKLVKNQSIPVSVPFCRPIEILNKDTVKTLLQFSEASGILPADADETWNFSEESITGPIPAAVIATESSQDGSESSNVVVVGSSVAFDSQLLGKTSLNNSSYFIGLTNKITNKENSINIESKTISQQSLGIVKSQALAIGIITIFALPVLVIAIGIFVWINRKKK